MAKDDQKAAKRRAAAKKRKEAQGGSKEGSESRVVSLTKEGAGRPAAMVHGAYETSAQFLREVRTELKKVTWPSRRDTLAATGVVLVIVFFVAAYLGLVDLLLSRMIGAILR